MVFLANALFALLTINHRPISQVVNRTKPAEAPGGDWFKAGFTHRAVNYEDRQDPNRQAIWHLLVPFSLGTRREANVAWSLATASWHGVGNDPVYVKSRCFETFSFPAEDTGLTAELRQRIATLAEQIDAHRKRAITPALSRGERKTKQSSLALTGTYNVLEALREGCALTAKEKTIHTQGLVSVLKDLHDELDAAVLVSYGLADSISNDALLTHLVAFNAQRAIKKIPAKFAG